MTGGRLHCAECFWFEASISDIVHDGICHRYPPAPKAVTVPDHWWCGEAFSIPRPAPEMADNPPSTILNHGWEPRAVPPAPTPDEDRLRTCEVWGCDELAALVEVGRFGGHPVAVFACDKHRADVEARTEASNAVLVKEVGAGAAKPTVPDLMAALEQSVTEAKATRARRQASNQTGTPPAIKKGKRR